MSKPVNKKVYNLKHCPLCGNKASLDREDIFCDKCGLSLSITNLLYNGEATFYEEAVDLAVETWNTRQPVKNTLSHLQRELPGLICGDGYNAQSRMDNIIEIIKEEFDYV